MSKSIGPQQRNKRSKLLYPVLAASIEWDRDCASDWRKSIPDITLITQNTVLQTGRCLPGNYSEGHITLFLTHDLKQQHLNKTFRGQDKSTNILSFASGTPTPTHYHLGDLSLALETIKREAVDQSKPIQDHYSHLLVHGILHLFGFTHKAKHDAKKMEDLEIEILNKLNIKNPYVIEGGDIGLE